MAAYSLGDALANLAQLQLPPPDHSQDPKARCTPPRAKSGRSRNRTGHWVEELRRWHAYQQWKATTEAELAEADAEYQRRLEACPDWFHYRAHSDYSAPHEHQLTAEDRRATLAAFDAAADWLYERRTPGDHSQRISSHYRDVLRYLLSLGVRFGKVFPSYQNIAEHCRCSRRTVASALAWLSLWGFLDWQRRIRRTAAGVVRQTTNAYRLVLKGLAAIGARIFGKADDDDGSECKTCLASANPIIPPAGESAFKPRS
jgi:hypothetical protein